MGSEWECLFLLYILEMGEIGERGVGVKVVFKDNVSFCDGIFCWVWGFDLGDQKDKNTKIPPCATSSCFLRGFVGVLKRGCGCVFVFLYTRSERDLKSRSGRTKLF